MKSADINKRPSDGRDLSDDEARDYEPTTFRRIGEILADAAKDRPRAPITRGIE
jgi:hypothetical protein